LSEDTYNTVKADDDYLVVERQDGVDGGVSLLTAAQQAAADGKKLFGLYGGPGGNFESPIPHDLPGTPLVTRATAENPLLKDAVLAALKVLGQDPDGLFLMAEQGDIDWANHANDFSRMVGTTWDLHEAVQTVIDYVNRPGDAMDWRNTLLLVTADHSNSYMRLIDTLGAGDLPKQEGTCGYGGPACTYPDGDVTYGSTSHTNELVRIYGDGAGAMGLLTRAEGAWYPGTTIIDNTQLYHVMTDAAGVPQPSPLGLECKRPRQQCGPRHQHKSDR
jgi:alkaline phosphatase